MLTTFSFSLVDLLVVVVDFGKLIILAEIVAILTRIVDGNEID
jgi:hypothetical protein